MKVIVTGGLGYIGSHTSLELLKKGHEILIIDNLSNSSKEVLSKIEFISKKRVTFINDDIDNIFYYLDLINDFNPKAVIHFAGLKSVEESEKKPLLYYEENVAKALKLIKFMNKIKCNMFVFSSSATVYGNPLYLPYDEKHPLKPINTYGKTKLVIEEILQKWCQADKSKKAIILRYFNPVGAHHSGLIGENPVGKPNNLMPLISRVAIGKIQKLSVFGDDYKTEDGSGVRDYIHVSDLAMGHHKALKYSLKNKGCHIFNLGAGKGISVFQMIKAFEKKSGATIKYKVVKRRPGDIAEFWANSSKARKELGWKTLHDVEKMCADTWEWEKQNFHSENK